MIDINLHHADLVLWPIDQEVAEHHRYLEELNGLDFTKKEHALYAIRKWLIPDSVTSWSTTGLYQRKEAIRYCFSKGLIYGKVWLPVISDIATGHGQTGGVGDMEKGWRLFTEFHFFLWSELFKEPFVPADLGQYRQRVDHYFMACPDAPELWGTPEYKDWD
jgi:hypothetical protein